MKNVSVSQDTLRLLQAYRARSEFAAPSVFNWRSCPEEHAAKDIIRLFTALVRDEKEGFGISLVAKKMVLKNLPLAEMFMAAATPEAGTDSSIIRLGNRQYALLESLKEYLAGKGALAVTAKPDEVLAYAVRAAHNMLDVWQETGGNLSLVKGAHTTRRHISGFNY